MSFLHPLGLLLALALPLIIVFHFRKQQVMEEKVSSLALWDQVLREVQGVKSRKINRYLLLLLQLLIGSLLVAAFARPVWVAPLPGEELTVALDCSLSMQALEGNSTRLEKAREELTGYLERLPDHVRLNLVLLHNKSRSVLEKASKQEVLAALAHIPGTGEALDVEMAAKVLAAYPEPRVVVTDKELPLGDRRIKVGGELDNLGITGGTYDYYSRTALCRIKNYGSSSRTAVLLLEDGQGHRDVQKVDIPAGKEAHVTWPRVRPEAQLLQVTIQNQDMLAMDNRFLLPVGDSYKKKVLMVGKSYYLQQALSSMPGINVEFFTQWDGVEDKYDLYITNQAPPVGALPANAAVWWLNPPGEMLGGQIDGPAPLTITPGPLARDLDPDLQGAYGGRCAVLKSQPGYQVVMEAAGKPVMEKGDRLLFSTLDWDNTNLTLLPAFPILVDNILAWFFRDHMPWLQPGDMVYPEQDRALQVKGPQGFSETLEGIPVTLGRPGIYYITENNRKLPSLIVNPPPGLVSGSLSPSQGQGNVVNGRDTGQRGAFLSLDMQGMVLVTVLVLLAAEWQVYRREL